MKSNGVVVFSSDKQEVVFSENRSHGFPCGPSPRCSQCCYLQAKVLFLAQGAEVNGLQVFGVLLDLACH